MENLSRKLKNIHIILLMKIINQVKKKPLFDNL